MRKMLSRSLFPIVLILNSILLINGKIINENVERTLDLSTHLVKETIKITASSSDGTPLNVYELIISEDKQNDLAFLLARDDSKKELKTKRIQAKNGKKFEVTFSAPAAKQTFYVDMVFANQQVPHPKEIKQAEKQYVKYTGNLYFYSPYATKTQKVAVKLFSSNIISYTQAKPYLATENKIKYGPFNDIPELANETLTIHTENQSPFLTVKHLERTIEVSHWGNIAVKENILMEHTGAKLKGSFSRYEFQKDNRFGQSAIKSYKTLLPASASGVNYRDTNGNISTSNMRHLRDAVELELRPRYPLFGGWKTQYTLAYNVPSFEYLFHAKDNFLLKMRVIDHIYDDMLVEHATVKIILPEGSSNIRLETPYDVQHNSRELAFTYLDIIGRPVISFSVDNLVEDHISDFNLKYNFSVTSMLIEPLLVISFIFIIFLFATLFTRLDFSINYHPHKE